MVYSRIRLLIIIFQNKIAIGGIPQIGGICRHAAQLVGDYGTYLQRALDDFRYQFSYFALYFHG